MALTSTTPGRTAKELMSGSSFAKVLHSEFIAAYRTEQRSSPRRNAIETGTYLGRIIRCPSLGISRRRSGTDKYDLSLALSQCRCCRL